MRRCHAPNATAIRWNDLCLPAALKAAETIHLLPDHPVALHVQAATAAVVTKPISLRLGV